MTECVEEISVELAFGIKHIIKGSMDKRVVQELDRFSGRMKCKLQAKLHFEAKFCFGLRNELGVIINKAWNKTESLNRQTGHEKLVFGSRVWESSVKKKKKIQTTSGYLV